MPGAALDQERHHVVVDPPALPHRPADDPGLVRVAGAVHVATGVEQGSNGVEVSAARSEVQCVCVVSAVAFVRVGAGFE